MSRICLKGVIIVCGGKRGGREIEFEDFEFAVSRAFGDQARASVDAAERLWGSLTNTIWTSEAAGSRLYSFRAAGDLVSAILQQGDYLDWYCCTRPGVVADDVRAAMARLGWTPRSMIDLDLGQSDP